MYGFQTSQISVDYFSIIHVQQYTDLGQYQNEFFLDSLEFRFFQQKKKVEVAPNYSLPFCCNKLWKEDTENCLWLDARLATRKYLMPDKRHSSYWSPCFHHPSKTESSDYFIHCNITTTQSWKTVTLSYQSGVFSYTKATVVKHSDSNQAK